MSNTMSRRDAAEYRRALAEREVAEREYCHLIERRGVLESRVVKNEALRARFLTRLNRDINDAHDRLVAADLALEAFR